MKKAGLSSILIAVVLVAVGAIAKAQEPTKVPRIAFLLGTSPGPDPRVEGFRQGLRDLGYVEGKNIAIEWRYAEGIEDLVPKIAAELVQLNVEIIVTDGTNVTRAAGTQPKRFRSSWRRMRILSGTGSSLPWHDRAAMSRGWSTSSQA
jgi:ABC-type uncharacterized transport system substrate-binding protein